MTVGPRASVADPSDAPPAAPPAADARVKVRALVEADDEALDSLLGRSVTVKGWVRTVRRQKQFSFVEVNDGSSLKGVQCIVATEEMDDPDSAAAALAGVSTGAAVAVRGVVKASQGAEQACEVQASALELVGSCADSKYPLQKKRHSLEFLRTIAHLRPRTNTIAAVARVRSTLAQATHEFFAGEVCRGGARRATSARAHAAMAAAFFFNAARARAFICARARARSGLLRRGG